jgi:hypothetical protein
MLPRRHAPALAAVDQVKKKSTGAAVLVPDSARRSAPPRARGIAKRMVNAPALYRPTIITLVARHRLPAIYPFRFFVTNGGLLSYGMDLADSFRGAANYVDRILKGAKPSELAVQLPIRFELIVNLKTAKAIGLLTTCVFGFPAGAQSKPDCRKIEKRTVLGYNMAQPGISTVPSAK